ncbi:type VI secretion system Vgr family protein [Phaeovulum sp. W22_SRMD_FR3]|uniref:type VI secretion system Vgr family protein n=1 Tax=Phaeovulum sp. W22_SRMD_FR3 TaxID=3240274 RepID=UPI003F9DB78C
MAPKKAENPLSLTGGFDTSKMEMQRAIIRERLSTLTEMQVEILWNDRTVDIAKVLGQIMVIEVEVQPGKTRSFRGIVISVEDRGLQKGMRHIVLELRTRMWMLTRNRNSRIFQSKTTRQIIEEVLRDHGLADFKMRQSETGPLRDYCVQYRESDFDFISRLMEEEGFYHFVDFDEASGDGLGTLVLADGKGAHKPISAPRQVDFIADRNQQSLHAADYIWEFRTRQAITTGRIELADFDFLQPKPNTVRKKTTLTAQHPYGDYEIYDHPGHFGQDMALGGLRAQVRLEARNAAHRVMQGVGNLRDLAAGRTFTFAKDGLYSHAQYGGKEYLVTGVVHYIQSAAGFQSVDGPPLQPALDVLLDARETYCAHFEAVESTVQFRAPLRTPWPEIPGLLTAIVVGKAGEEIWTDAQGRIKVKFHWDRTETRDETTTCWVRVVTPWAGKGWGMAAVPRIGQEVVIQFEEGDPDRPICTGMLYNGDNKPPYAYPDNATQSGMISNSSKSGGGYNELMFEDKKDEELVRFRAERDYEQVVRNNATVTIGDKKDAGDLTLTVHNNLTEKVLDGDMSTTVAKGNQTITVETGNQDTTIKKGHQTQTVETGNQTVTISQGNQSTTVSMGDLTVKVSTGKISMEAMSSIELKCGASSIKLEPAKVTIKAPVVEVKADGKMDISSPITTVKGDGMLTLKGGMTMIN